MANWLQRLETAWSRRHVRDPHSPPEDQERKPVCVITGASEGIGRHLADQFAAQGHAILLIARNAANLERAAAELRAAHRAEIFTAALDLAAPEPARRVREALDGHGLYCDILVNNAAFGIGGLFAERDAGRIDALCRLNVEAVTALTRQFLPAMLARGRGGILNIASLGGLTPGPYQAAYYASKAHVLSLTEALASENAGRGVRISAAAPGPVATRFHERMGTQDAFYSRSPSFMSAEKCARIIHSGFAGRRSVIVPGLLPSLASFFMRFVPHAVLLPFIGWILRQRY